MVRSLRRKLGDDEGKPKYIFNERGLSYRLPAPEDPENGASASLTVRARPMRWGAR